jgi:hypothetical protein
MTGEKHSGYIAARSSGTWEVKMRRSTSKAFAVLLATVFTTAVQAAPNCGLVGKWHVNAILGFASGQGVVDCTINIQPTGVFTATGCKTWITGQASSIVNGSGTIKADAACHLRGVLKASGIPSTTIGGGKVEGTVATLVGYRGSANNPNQVRMYVLLKE